MKLSTLFLSSVAFGLMAAPALAEAPASTTTTATTCQPAPTAPCGENGQIPFVQNEQIQLQSAYSGADLTAGSVDSAALAAAASANLLTVGAQGPRGVIVDSIQGAFGTTTAQSTMDVGHADGHAVNAAAATANGLTAGSENGTLVMDSTQVVHPGADVNAWSYTRSVNVGGAANTAAAGANVTTLNTANGGVDARVVQNSAANVRATAEADHCCVRSAATGAAVASANNVTGTSTGGGPAVVSTDQRSSGREVIALVDLYVGFTGDAVVSAAANANATTYGGAFAPLEFNVTQVNSSDVTAEGYLTVGGDYTGVVSASSYGVGNSAVGQNAGADARFVTDQFNGGRVTSYTAVSGDGGVGATGTAVAVGNMASGAVCTVCGPATLIANNRQVNNGSITAATTMVSGSTGTIVGAATAVGNSATYTIRSGH